jgi:histone H3/H4
MGRSSTKNKFVVASNISKYCHDNKMCLSPALVEVLDERIKEFLDEAILFCKSVSRKTLMDKDIEFIKVRSQDEVMHGGTTRY